MAVLAAGIIVGCSGNTGTELFSPPDEAVVWPRPPEQTRIQYVGQMASDRDLGKQESFLDRLKDGLLGTEQAQLLTQRPFDVYANELGRVYVSNGATGALLVLEPQVHDAQVLVPSGAGELAKPMGLAGDRAGRLYVADPPQRRVVALDYSGNFVKAFGGTSVLLNPVDVAVSPDGEFVYVADSYLHQVVVFDRDGNLVRRIGKDEGDIARKELVRSKRYADVIDGLDHAVDDQSAAHGLELEPADLTENRGVAPGEFRYPAFVEVAPNGTVYVSDGMNFRVQAFDAEGGYLHEFGRHGQTPGSFARPKGIAVDSENHVYVADAAFNNVQIFDDRGQLLLAFGGFGPGPGKLWMPIGLTIDSSDRIYVADRYNNRVQVYQYVPEADAPVVQEDATSATREPDEQAEADRRGG